MPFIMRLRRDFCPPALVLCAIAALLIWGNSMVPGSGSSAISLEVVDLVRAGLDALELPSGWVSNLLIRKAAHVTEYTLLGVLALRACTPGTWPSRASVVRAAVLCVGVAAIDETIQRFVPGRCGQSTDVLIDSCGVVLGIALSVVLLRAWHRRRAQA